MPSSSEAGGNKLFYLAIISGNKQAVNHFIKNGEDVNYIDNHYRTPLMHAVVSENIEICKMLLEAGADPHYQYKKDYSTINLINITKNENLINLINNYINKKQPETETESCFFDFGDQPIEGWVAEDETCIPESDINLLNKLKKQHGE